MHVLCTKKHGHYQRACQGRNWYLRGDLKFEEKPGTQTPGGAFLKRGRQCPVLGSTGRVGDDRRAGTGQVGSHWPVAGFGIWYC